MDLNKILKLTDKEMQLIVFLEKCTKGKWTINKKTGLVDIEGDFNCKEKKLKDFKGARFGVVKGDFDCSKNNLTSLVGAPQEVKGNFICSYNNLTSLEGAPQKVGEEFDCSHNKLTSLEGAPQVVEGSFFCYHNNLTSLKGSPQKVEGDFNCAHNFKLTSLEGAPQKVGRRFHCSAIYAKSPTPANTLELVFEVMQKNKIDYWTALSILKSRIDSEEWVVMSKGIDSHISKDTQKGISMLDRFGHFD